MLKLRHSVLIISLLSSFFAAGQTNFSLSFGGSYGFGVFENSVETFVNTKQENNAYLSENKKFSLGAGLGIYANAMYHFQDNFGLGIGVNKHFNTDVEFIEINAVSGVIAENTRILSSKRFSIRPMIQVNTDFEKFNTYIQLGVSFNMNKQSLNETIIVDTMETKLFWDYEGKTSLGFFTQLGLNYNFSEKLSMILGLTLDAFQYTPSHNYLQKMTHNGNNVSIYGLPEIFKSVEFLDWVSDQYSQYPDPDKPLKSPKQTFIYHSLSLSLGLSYRF